MPSESGHAWGAVALHQGKTVTLAISILCIGLVLVASLCIAWGLA